MGGWKRFKEAAYKKSTWMVDKLGRGNNRLSIDSPERYRLLGVIFDGGAAGVIYRARDKTTMDSKSVVVKVAKKEMNAEVQREVDRYATFGKHQNVMELISSFHDSAGRLCMVLPRMDSSLDDVLQRNIEKGKKLTEDEIAAFTFQMLRGINLIHAHGLVHRDIKPDNLLLKGSRLRVTDMGSSTTEDDERDVYIVTRFYRPPEVAYGRFPYSFKVDVWSSGCVFAEMYSGQRVFESESSEALKGKYIEVLGLPSLIEWANILPDGTDVPTDVDTSSTSHLNEILDKAKVPGMAKSLITRILKYNAADRPTAMEAMADPYFNAIRKNVNFFWLFKGLTRIEIGSHSKRSIERAFPKRWWSDEANEHFSHDGVQGAEGLKDHVGKRPS